MGCRNFCIFFCLFACFAILVNVFSRGRETVQLAVLVGRSVCHNPELQAVFALLPLPNHLRSDPDEGLQEENYKEDDKDGDNNQCAASLHMNACV